MTHTDDDFKTLRRYSRQEAAALLHIRDSWLKVWVTDDVIPHRRSGTPGPRQRGVWFTYDDILAIGRMLPSLMSPRQANGRVEGRVDGASAAKGEVPRTQADLVEGVSIEAPPHGVVSDDEWAAFAGLASLRA